MDFAINDRCVQSSNSIDWSDDGIISIACQQEIHLYVPIWKNKQTQDFKLLEVFISRKDLKPKETSSKALEGIGFANLSTEYFKSVKWSPRAYARTGGCLLLVHRSTDTLDVIDFSSITSDTAVSGLWETSGPFDFGLSGILSIDWSAHSHRLNVSLVAIACSDCTIQLYTCERLRHNCPKFSKIGFIASDSHFEWPIRVSFGNFSSTGDEITLAVAYSSGAALVYRLELGGAFQSTVLQSYFESDRTAISSITRLHSLGSSGGCGFAIAKGFDLHVVRVDGGDVELQTVKGRAGYCSSYFYNKFDRTLWGFSQHGKFFKLQLDDSNRMVAASTGPDEFAHITEKLIGNNSSLLESKAKNCQIRYCGVATSYFGEFLLVHCHFDAKNEHEYKTEKTTVSLFSIIRLDAPRPVGFKLEDLPPGISSNRVLFDLYYGLNTRANLDQLVNLDTSVPAFIYAFKYASMANCSLQSYSAADFTVMREHLLALSLRSQLDSWHDHILNGLLSEFDWKFLAILLAGAVLVKRPFLQATVEFILDRLEAMFPFNSDLKALREGNLSALELEKCKCGLAIPFTSLYTGQCLALHTFRRCTFSLLLVTSFSKQRCFNCDAVYLYNTSVETRNPSIDGLYNLESCIYCNSSLSLIHL